MKKKVKLIIVGPRDKKEWKKIKKLQKKLKLSEDTVIFVNAVPNEKVKDTLAACDIFTLTSEFEVLGYSLLEAMAQKKPLVAFDVGGISDVKAQVRELLEYDKQAVEDKGIECVIKVIF